eukprot:Rmarinus@m.19435
MRGSSLESFWDGLFFERICQEVDDPEEFIYINVYYDDVNPTNGLAPSNACHNVAAFYYSILNLPPSIQLRQNAIQFIASALESDVVLSMECWPFSRRAQGGAGKHVRHRNHLRLPRRNPYEEGLQNVSCLGAG